MQTQREAVIFQAPMPLTLQKYKYECKHQLPVSNLYLAINLFHINVTAWVVLEESS